MASRSSAVVEDSADHENGDRITNRSFGAAADSGTGITMTTTSMAYSPQFMLFRELRHDEFEAYVPTGLPNTGVVSKWRIKDRVRCASSHICFHYNSLNVVIFWRILCEFGSIF